jgi:hypothetical protein
MKSITGRSFRGARITIATALLLATAGVAQADTIWFEAEDLDAQADIGAIVTITTPMRVVDRADASGGASIEVENGLDSKTSAPTLGRACYKFEVATAGTYRVWGRVIARTDNDDSFWARMDNGAWIKWNEIALGENWHWDFVHNDTAPTTPSTFSLSSGQHTFCVAYREDDTRLDVMVVTDDTSFNPSAAITGAPATPGAVRVVDGNLALQISWRTILGATSYTLERSDDNDITWHTIASNLTGHVFTDTNNPETNVRYRVTAHAPTGSSAAGENFCCYFFFEDFGAFSFAENLSLTAPMQVVGSAIATTTGTESLNSVPSTGWARFDFRTATGGTFKAHAQVEVGDGNHDSFWVRIDNQPWIKWNNITTHDPCDYDTIHNSDVSGSPQVSFTVPAGSHTFELAYRELNAKVFKLFLSTTPTDDEGFGLCFD